MTTETSELRPCPWCNTVGLNLVTHRVQDLKGNWRVCVWCMTCGARGPTFQEQRCGIVRSGFEARRLWNERSEG